MSAYTTEGGRTATYPSNGYPSANFAGAGMPGRAGTPGRPGGSRGAVSAALPGLWSSVAAMRCGISPPR